MKNVYGNIYFSRNALGEVPTEIRDFVLMITNNDDSFDEFNLIKVSKDRDYISLMYYPHLETHSHPYLEKSLKLSLSGKSSKVRYDSSQNPVILHRLELMLPSTDPRIGFLTTLTADEEKLGFYSPDKIKFIGRRKYWNDLCRTHGQILSLAPEDNLLAEQLSLFDSVNTFKIDRGKTAMATKKPSAPTRIFTERGVVKGNIYDWGSGRGRDSNYLRGLGYDVTSYDKFHNDINRPEDIDFSKIDFIICNYVLNVIEDTEERKNLLTQIASSSKVNDSYVLLSVRHDKEIKKFAEKSNWRSYNDGYITSKNTFQKGFELEELVNYTSKHFLIVDKIVNQSYISLLLKRK